MRLLSLCLLILSAAFLFGCSIFKEKPEPPVSMKVPFPPIPVKSADAVNLAYELELSRYRDKFMTLLKAEAIDQDTGKTLLTLKKDSLDLNLHPADTPPPNETERLAGTRRLYYPRVSLWVKVKAGAVPSKLVHRLTFAPTEFSAEPVIIIGAETEVLTDVKPPVISPPLRGSGWVAVETTRAASRHFQTQMTKNGLTCVPERFAQDWLLLNPEKKDFVSGDFRNNANWFSYGKDILAVSDGTVIKIRDGVPDNREAGKSGEDPSGNYLTLDIGNSAYASYLHIKPGSFRVKEGEKVRKGDTLALAGNSGASFAPHLHFQITNKPDLVSEGIPFVFDSFEDCGACPATQAATFGMDLPDLLMKYFTSKEFPVKEPIFYPQLQKRKNEIVENLSIINFK